MPGTTTSVADTKPTTKKTASATTQAAVHFYVNHDFSMLPHLQALNNALQQAYQDHILSAPIIAHANSEATDVNIDQILFNVERELKKRFYFFTKNEKEILMQQQSLRISQLHNQTNKAKPGDLCIASGAGIIDAYKIVKKHFAENKAMAGLVILADEHPALADTVKPAATPPTRSSKRKPEKPLYLILLANANNPSQQANYVNNTTLPLFTISKLCFVQTINKDWPYSLPHTTTPFTNNSRLINNALFTPTQTDQSPIAAGDVLEYHDEKTGIHFVVFVTLLNALIKAFLQQRLTTERDAVALITSIQNSLAHTNCQLATDPALIMNSTDPIVTCVSASVREHLPPKQQFITQQLMLQLSKASNVLRLPDSQVITLYRSVFSTTGTLSSSDLNDITEEDMSDVSTPSGSSSGSLTASDSQSSLIPKPTTPPERLHEERPLTADTRQAHEEAPSTDNTGQAHEEAPSTDNTGQSHEAYQQLYLN